MIDQESTFAMGDPILDDGVPVGDVLAARRAAAELLRPLPPASLAVLAQLTLTAAMMIAQCNTDESVSLALVRMALTQLLTGQDVQVLKCRAQLVRYAAFELAAQPPRIRQQLVRWFDGHFEDLKVDRRIATTATAAV